MAIDGNDNTYWITDFSTNPGNANDPAHPHHLVIGLGQGHQISGISYLARQDQEDGRVAGFEISLSTDGANWTGALTSGTFVNDGGGDQNVAFETSFPLSEVDIGSSPAADTATDVSFTATTGYNLEYQWSFGDGTALQPFSDDPDISHTFQTPGRFVVVLTVRDTLTGQTQSHQLTQIIYDSTIDPTDDVQRRLGNTSVLFHPTRNEIWNVNPDNASATVIDASALTKMAEIPVGPDPRSLAGRPGRPRVGRIKRICANLRN